MKRIIKRLFFSILLAAASLGVAAQDVADTSYVFRFQPDSDMFFVPWQNNGVQLDALLATVRANKQQLAAGQRYVLVSSYYSDGQLRNAYTRALRVKSELITRAGLTEQMFVTERSFAKAYQDSLRNVVVVSFPASVDKVASIAGAEAAAKVEAYNKELLASAEPQPVVKEEPQEEKVATAVQAAPVAAEEPTAASPVTERTQTPHLQLRTNLLRWATLTPDLGIEWRINRNWGIAVGGSWTSWTWSHNDRRYALWEVAPEIHYYIGATKRGYVGAMFKTGEYNYKLSATGRQGDILGGGMVGGYQLPLNKRLSLDFHLAVGYLRAEQEKYIVENGLRLLQSAETKNWYGPMGAGVTLTWTIF